MFGGIGTSSSSSDNYYFYYYFDWDVEDNWEYSNRIVVQNIKQRKKINDLTSNTIIESGTTAAMSFGSLVVTYSFFLKNIN